MAHKFLIKTNKMIDHLRKLLKDNPNGRYTAKINNAKAINPKQTPVFDKWVDTNNAIDVAQYADCVPGTSTTAWKIIHGLGGEQPHIQTNGLLFQAVDNTPFTMRVSDEGGTFDGSQIQNLQYSLDDGLTWNDYSIPDSDELSVTSTILWKADCWNLDDPDSDDVEFMFDNVSSSIKVVGDITWLCGHGATLPDGTCFVYLFYDSPISDASNLYLPSNTTSSCYNGMFANCTSLPTAPALPATTLEDSCYAYMFSGCTSLTTSPSLPATTLAAYCYANMFNGCTSLVNVPTLSATTLANSCYSNMFASCSSIVTPPALPATVLAKFCYNEMFRGCTSLTSAPALPATILAEDCYFIMFGGCTSLVSAPALPATSLAPRCYASMFSGCTSLTTSPSLPATTLAPNCYSNMFRGCSALTSAPVLPATTLAEQCYGNMFDGCTSLTSAPALPATTLVQYCYQNIFYGCSSLNDVTIYASDTSATQCLINWLTGTAPSGTVHCKLTFPDASVPSGWTKDGTL